MRTLWLIGLVIACSSAERPRAEAEEEPEAEAEAPAPRIVNEPREPEPVSPSATAESGLRVRSQTARRGVAHALARGRRLARAGEHAAALRELERGLELDDQHRALLCEAGWAAFHADSPDAERLLRRGSSLDGPPSARAACLYNLGRWYEREAERSDDEGHRSRAIEAYRRSLSLRPSNAETRRRYRALAGHAPDPCPAALLSSTLRGTCDCVPSTHFPDVDAACAALLSFGYAPEEREYRTYCGVDDVEIDSNGDAPGELFIIRDQSDVSGGWSTWFLALRTDHVELLVDLGASWDRSCSYGSLDGFSATWTSATHLVVELDSIWYACELSEAEACLQEAERAERAADECDDLSWDTPPDPNVDRRRAICVREDGRWRCTRPGLSVSTLEAHQDARAPMPTNASFERHLCTT